MELLNTLGLVHHSPLRQLVAPTLLLLLTIQLLVRSQLLGLVLAKSTEKLRAARQIRLCAAVTLILVRLLLVGMNEPLAAEKLKLAAKESAAIRTKYAKHFQRLQEAGSMPLNTPAPLRT